MSKKKLRGSLRNAGTVLRQSNDPRRTTDPRKIWRDSTASTGNELGNWSPSTFGDISPQIQAQREQEAAANESALSQQARDIFAQTYGGAYGGGQMTGGQGQGLLQTPTTMTPQQTPNMGLPQMQNPMMANRGGFADYMNQLRQGAPIGGYRPLLPQTMMMPQIAPQQPQPSGPPGTQTPPYDPNIGAIMKMGMPQVMQMPYGKMPGQTPPYNPNQRMGLF